MNVTVVGAGNIGTQFAVHCAEKGHQVIVYGSRPERIHKHLSIIDENGILIHEGEIVQATDDSEIAFSNAHVVFVTMPAYCMEDIAEIIYPFAHNGMKIGLIPGTGGGECAFKRCMEKGCIIFGLQRVPSVARLKEYGKVVCATGYRSELHIAALPQYYTEESSALVSELFNMPCVALPNYLNITLTPSNPILHTTRLRILFEDFKDGVGYGRIPLFYEEWDNRSSELLIQCDDEVQKICNALDRFDLSYVKSLKIHYESDTPQQLTKKISSIKGFKGLKTPMIEKNGTYIPDLDSRYFTADFPFGLAILVQIAELVDVDVPYMKKTLQWYHRIDDTRKMFEFKKFGIVCLEEFISFYNQ